MPHNVYIGYDAMEGDAFEVCKKSLLDNATDSVNVVRLDVDWLRRIGLYRRQFFVEDGQKFDSRDGRPFSTDFSFTRFLVPSLQPEGFALFCDSDFLWLDDVAKLFDHARSEFAVMCVRHDYSPKEDIKMRGQVQQPYHRKNWSSLMIWNCDHPLSRMLTPYLVNTAPGRWLHGFEWMQCQDIGGLPPQWNWLEGHSDPKLVPSAVHFTRGTPDMPGWGGVAYADEWVSCMESIR